MSRFIGIRHRVKKSKEGEARPTQVAILEGGKIVRYDLDDETAELDFVKGQFPVEFRPVEDDEELSKFKVHQVKTRKLKKGESPDDFPQNLIRRESKTEVYLALRVPTAFDGLREGDTVAMLLGGSGDFFAYALARKSLKIGAEALRMPAYQFLDVRGDRPKDDDAELLANHVRTHRQNFYKVEPRDADQIKMRLKLRERIDAMKDKIACEQRLRQRHNGAIFCSDEGEFSEGSVEKAYEATKANDEIYLLLCKAEAKRARELTQLVEALPVYQKVFSTVEGCGPMISSRIIAAMIDRRRFKSASKLKAYFGVHLQNFAYCGVCDKKFDWLDCHIGESDLACPKCHSNDITTFQRFPRRRNSETANWADECRKALFILADQFNMRQDSEWGQLMLRYKIWFKGRHPEVVITGKRKKKFTPAHIHKMAIWRTLTRFVEWLFAAMRDTDEGKPLPPIHPGPNNENIVPVPYMLQPWERFEGKVVEASEPEIGEEADAEIKEEETVLA